jgi:hypothetical protein
MRLGTVENMRHDDDSPNDNRTQQLNPEALAAEVTGFLEQVPVGELVGAKLSRVLDGFLQGEVFPQADRAAGQGIDSNAAVGRHRRGVAPLRRRPPPSRSRRVRLCRPWAQTQPTPLPQVTHPARCR